MPYEKVGENAPVCIADQAPFEIPESWEWVRLKNFCLDVFSGKTPRYAKVPTEYHVVGQAANQQHGLDMSQLKFTDATFWNSMEERYFLKKYDVLLNTLGNGTLGRSGIVINIPYQLLTDGHLFVFRAINKTSAWYLYYYFQYKKEEIEKDANGSTNQTFLTLNKTIKCLLPLPPLAEQKRIVDTLQTIEPHLREYAEKESALTELQSAFPEQLKKSILQQAVMGKLVPQDPSDEPASVLLERIHAEKQRLVKEGKIKKDKHESVIYRRDNSHYEKLDGIERCIDDEIPFEIPENWEWVSIGSIFNLQAGKTVVASDIRNEIEADYYPCFGGNGLRGFVPFYNHDGDYPIIGRQGALCGCINRAKGKFYATEHAVCVDTFADTDITWVCYFLTAINLNQYATATAQPGLAVSKINHILVPLPPLAEQQRIVARIEELMQYCEKMK